MRARVQRDGHAGGGALEQGAVRQGPQQQPGELPDVGHALDELLGPGHETRLDNIRDSLPSVTLRG